MPIVWLGVGPKRYTMMAMKNLKAKLVATLCLAALCLTVGGCKRTTDDGHQQRAIYYWRTNYNPTAWEQQFLHDHHIERLYLRLFDVVPNDSYYYNERSAVPEATVTFSQSLPDKMEVVPVVFVSHEGLAAMHGQVANYADKLLKRVDAIMAAQSKPYSEMQLDCDMYASQHERFVALCDALRGLLHERGRQLNITVRLHQLKDIDQLAAVVDRMTLMVYNTGRLQDVDTRNSILDIDDAKPYLDLAGQLPANMDYAFPVYSWGVKFYGTWFDKLVNRVDLADTTSSDTLRFERGEVDQIEQVKALLRNKMSRRHASSVILYHLDEHNLKDYTYEEIEAVLDL